LAIVKESVPSLDAAGIAQRYSRPETTERGQGRRMTRLVVRGSRTCRRLCDTAAP
jgi:hypothetical protein